MSQILTEDYPCSFCGWIDGEHAPGCLRRQDESEEICHAQGGGNMNYRLLAWDEQREEFMYYDTYSDTRERHAQCKDAGAFTGPIEINCPKHGWQITLWEECSKCRAERLEET